MLSIRILLITESVTIAVLSVLFDFLSFYKISRIKVQGIKDYLFLTCSFIFLFILRSWGGVFAELTSIVEILLFLLFYRKKDKIIVTGSIFIAVFVDYIWQVSYLVITNSVASHSGLRLEIETVIAYYIIAFLLVNRYKNVFYRYLCDQNRKIFWSIFFYLYVSLLILNLIDEFMDEITPSTLGFICMLIAQMIFSVVIYILIVHSQEEHRKIEQTMLKRQQQKQLEEYASYLEKSEDELRAFRHDYRNMFNSLKISAQEGKVQEVIDKLDKYTQSNLDSQALLKYKDINHIHIKSLKSIIISKLTELYDQKIPYNLECRQDISQLPEGVDELDLVRIIGITCDNAIEESKSMQEKGETPEVQIMFYSDETGEIEYEICNKLRASKLSIKKIQEQGYTTKKNHQGFGLANIKTIENKYPDMSISYNIRDGWFDFYMTIDSEDDE
ncbi:hypothetical protein GCM10022297_13400 [Lactobacillus hamsteri]|uniref:GHKL domain-containing protein n=1 Tax=Lactobacillus hamsteri TaxID=96565 RepID=UPI00046A9F82